MARLLQHSLQSSAPSLYGKQIRNASDHGTPSEGAKDHLVASMSMVVPCMEGSTGRIVLGAGKSFTIAKSGPSFGTGAKQMRATDPGFSTRRI